MQKRLVSISRKRTIFGKYGLTFVFATNTQDPYDHIFYDTTSKSSFVILQGQTSWHGLHDLIEVINNRPARLGKRIGDQGTCIVYKTGPGNHHLGAFAEMHT